MSFSGCTFYGQRETIDLDIRSLEVLRPVQHRRKFEKCEAYDGVGRLIVNGSFADTIYYHKRGETNLIFFREINFDGVTKGDNFIFFDSGCAYRVRISDELSPDYKHFVSVFKYSEGYCVNLEGKVYYNRPLHITDSLNLDIISLINSMTEIDSNIFKFSRKDFRLSSYFQ